MIAVDEKLKQYAAQEAYIWLCVHGNHRVMFGWIIQVHRKRDDPRLSTILFKDDALSTPVRISFEEIEQHGRI